jgi:hypothetical protein
MAFASRSGYSSRRLSVDPLLKSSWKRIGACVGFSFAYGLISAISKAVNPEEGGGIIAFLLFCFLGFEIIRWLVKFGLLLMSAASSQTEKYMAEVKK